MKTVLLSALLLLATASPVPAWRKLLRAPGGWKGKVPTSGDCYRFCLASPHVDVVLTGPRTVAELRENLAAVDRRPLSHAEMEDMRAFGGAVHG